MMRHALLFTLASVSWLDAPHAHSQNADPAIAACEFREQPKPPDPLYRRRSAWVRGDQAIIVFDSSKGEQVARCRFKFDAKDASWSFVDEHDAEAKVCVALTNLTSRLIQAGNVEGARLHQSELEACLPTLKRSQMFHTVEFALKLTSFPGYPIAADRTALRFQ
jgi:hypothetical protein